MSETPETQITLAELERRFPVVDWREPIAMTVSGTTRFGCRICIAQQGLRAEDVVHGATGYDTVEEALKHISAHAIEEDRRD